MLTATKLRKQADQLSAKALRLMDIIPSGQPIVSRADRNRRERSWEILRKANDLLREADALDRKKSEVA